MVVTEKSALYKKCLRCTDNQEDYRIYKMMYKKTTALFWKMEYKKMLYNHIQSRHVLKTLTYKLPIEMHFHIASYLDDFKN